MKALIDADILAYECAWGSQDRESGEIFSFDSVRERVDQKILDICDAVGADSYQLYLTGKGNFRENIAVSKPYKGNRVQEKPFHFKNTRAYLESLGAIVVQGMEADDAMVIAQMENLPSNLKECREKDTTVICTRDKDLRQAPGWHYGWEMGLQPEYKLRWIDELGDLELIERSKKKEVKGHGLKFFYSQLITGDATDNIPGLRLGGAAKAYQALKDAKTEQEMYLAVRKLYKERAIKDYPHLGEGIDAHVDELILEQGRLLWMVRELDEDGNPVMWNPPDICKEE